jgi:hypothetical protein
MQLAAKQAADQDSASTPDPSDSDYVGKHRPHRLSLHPRVRAGKVTAREAARAQ